MTNTARRVLAEALELTPEDRVAIAGDLLDSLDPQVEARDEAQWLAEIERRADEAIAGKPGVAWETVRSEVETRLQRV